MCALIGEVSQAVSIAVVTTNCEIVSRTHSSEEVFVMEMGEQSISLSMSRVAEKATSTVINRGAEQINPIVRGWLNYFMSYCKSAVSYTMHCLNERLCRWVRHKFKRFRGHKIKAQTWLQELAKREPNMFAHWALGWKP